MTAIGQAVTKTQKTAAKLGANKVTFLILTDGHENSSREFTHAKVKALIDQCTADGWQVIFLGADLTINQLKETTMEKKAVRQGDVLVWPTSAKLPSNSIPDENGRFVLAHGEEYMAHLGAES